MKTNTEYGTVARTPRMLAFAAALFICLSIFSFLPAYAVTPSTTPPRVVDTSDLLSASEEAVLVSAIKALAEKTGLDCVIYTTDTLGGKSAEACADDYYDYNGYGYGATNDGVLLLICIGSRDYHISTTGLGIKVLNDSRINTIEDSIVGYMSDGDWIGACERFVSLTADSYDAYSNGWSGMSKPQPPWILMLFIVPGLSFLIGWIVAKSKKAMMNNALPKKQATDYVRKNSFVINDSRDLFLYSRVAKIKRATESSSGGSSTHTGSSGTTHGGGGGKF